MSFVRSSAVILLPALLFGPASAPLNAAADDETAPESVDFFEKQIRPLLASRCYECHSVRENQREGGLTLDDREGWATGGSRGPAVIPRDADASLLITAVRHRDQELRMPPDQPLSPKEIALLEQWVRMGAPDPRQRDVSHPSASSPAPSDPVAGRTHWAFQPLSRISPQHLAEDNWSRTEIDRFVFAKMRESQLSPAEDADAPTLLRRLYYSLTGLPPSLSLAGNELTDDSPGFCIPPATDGALPLDSLVDQLLVSRRFGEHWGRHWLDLARYADSNGLDENFLFREAWRYRNWVIDAVCSDLPFDQFLTQQIAGDLLPYDSTEQRDRQRIAAGFLVVGPKVLLGNDPSERIMDVADEQLDTIGRTFLGQTLGCARCHDHKFDPVPAADYYALAGIMTSTSVMEQRYMLGQQRDMEQLIGLGEDGHQRDVDYEHYWREGRAHLQQRLQHAMTAVSLIAETDPAALTELTQKHPDAVADGIADGNLPADERKQRQEALIAQLREAIDKPPVIPPRAMIPSDRETPRTEAVRLAGRFDRPGETVPRGFLQVLGDGSLRIPDNESGRRQLAQWLTDTEHGAGHLTARVIANRIWYHLMGRGIVRTVDNFGRTGEPPSHPELLDFLASELIASGWSVRELVRQIVLSRTFAVSSSHDAACHAVDPDNRLLWRAHRRRLSPEALRDSMLLAAGTLDLNPVNSTVDYLGDQATAVGDNKNRRRTDFPCRSVYLPVIRNDLPELFDVFNFADPHTTTGMRPTTLVAPQGLFLLNNPLVMDAAEATARHVLAEPAEPAAMAQRLVERVLRMPANPEETADLVAFVEDANRRFAAAGDSEPAVKAWAAACHAVFASSRFQILE